MIKAKANWQVCDEHEQLYLPGEECVHCKIQRYEKIIDEIWLLPEFYLDGFKVVMSDQLKDVLNGKV